MSGTYVYRATPPHGCFPPSGANHGDIWRCDKCGKDWERVRGQRQRWKPIYHRTGGLMPNLIDRFAKLPQAIRENRWTLMLGMTLMAAGELLRILA